MQTCPSHVILQRVVVQIIYCSGVRLAATSSRQRRLYFKFYGKKLFIMLIFGNGHWSHKFTFYHLRNQIKKYFGLHRITTKLLATIQINVGCCFNHTSVWSEVKHWSIKNHQFVTSSPHWEVGLFILYL